MHSTEFQYIQTSHRSQVFLAHYIPLQPVNSVKGNHRAVIFVPPLAEEMNRSKRMYVLCARLLANSGIHAVIFDYSGTGDSSGEWGEFGYTDWIHDIQHVYAHCTTFADNINFVALRFGALILSDVIQQSTYKDGRCVFWDPVENGEVLVRQLIRIKIAAAMADESKKLTTKEILDDIQATGFLESGGYKISKALIDDINSKKLSTSLESVLTHMEMNWMQLGKHTQTEKQWLSNSISEGDLSQDSHKKIIMHPVNDVKFWMQQEVTIAPELLRETHRAFF